MRWLPALLLVGCIPDWDAPVVTGDDETFVFEVPKGSTASGIGPALAEAGLIPGMLQWKIFLRASDASCLKAGRFQVRRSLSLNELVATLCGVPMADDVPFTVLEGWRIRDVDEALAAKGLIEAGTYIHAATTKSVPAPFEVSSPSYEGYLWPETYMVPASGVDPEVLIGRQLETFQTAFLAKHPDGFGDRTLHEIVVVASMLEREEPRPSNRPMVAGIMWKRIDSDTPLGIDATSRYTIAKWNDRRSFLVQLKDPSDPYNSRLRKGLPPTAIGAPTATSLEAAMNPIRSENWYYLHDAEGNLHPARNAVQHEANRKKYNVY